MGNFLSLHATSLLITASSLCNLTAGRDADRSMGRNCAISSKTLLEGL